MRRDRERAPEEFRLIGRQSSGLNGKGPKQKPRSRARTNLCRSLSSLLRRVCARRLEVLRYALPMAFGVLVLFAVYVLITTPDVYLPETCSSNRDCQDLKSALNLQAKSRFLSPDVGDSMDELFELLLRIDVVEESSALKRGKRRASIEGEDAPLVTVVVPMYNAQRTLHASMRSIREQTYEKMEIVLVDDSSTDHTLEVARRLLILDERIRILEVPTSRSLGPYVAMNYGIFHARGRYVAIHGADDISHPSRIEVQVNAMESAEVSTGQKTSDNSREQRGVLCAPEHSWVSPNLDLLTNGGEVRRMSFPGAMFRRDIFDTVGFFDSVRVAGSREYLERLKTVFGGKSILSVKTLKKGATVHVPLYYAFYRPASLQADKTLGFSFTDDKSPPLYEAYDSHFQAWHKEQGVQDKPTMGRSALYVDFPMRHRPFTAPGEMYVKAPWADQKVVASIAAVKKRQASFQDAALSVAHSVDTLYVYLNDFKASEVSQNISNLANVQLVDSPDGNIHDTGRMHVLKAMKGKLRDTYLLTLDESIIYPTDYVQRMILKIEEHKRKAIVGVHCANVQPGGFGIWDGEDVQTFWNKFDEDKHAHILGTGTTAWHTSTMPGINMDHFPISDTGLVDLYLAQDARDHKVETICVARPDNWLRPAEHLNVKESYLEVYKSLWDPDSSKEAALAHKIYPEVFGRMMREDDD